MGEVCEKLSERVPVPKEKQVCHDEKKKVCELEQRSQPKQVKKYVYTKQCRPVPKTVCEMKMRCHWFQAVSLHLARNVATILRSAVRMYRNNIATKFLIKFKRWNVLKQAMINQLNMR